MLMLRGLRASSQQRNLVLVGGVALNSVLNGLIAESKLFDNVYIPPCPGDEGIAVGCAMYGLQVCVLMLGIPFTDGLFVAEMSRRAEE